MLASIIVPPTAIDALLKCGIKECKSPRSWVNAVLNNAN